MDQKKKQIAVFIVIISSLLTSLVHCPLFEIFDYDKELFRYMGMAIVKGQVPYRDFFDHKPPLIYFLNALAYGWGSWGIFLISSVLSLIASLMLYIRCRNQELKWPWLLPVLFNVLLRIPIISMGMGLTREYTTVFFLMFFCASLSRHRFRYLLLGFLGALTFAMQQDQVLLLVPFLVYDILKDRFRGFMPKTLQLIAGTLPVIVPLLVYFSANHALQPLWEDAFRFNTQWYSASPAITGMIRFLVIALGAGGLLLPLGAALICSLLLLRGHRQKALLFCALLVVLLSPGSYFISGRPILYYMQPFAASIPVLLYVLFSYSDIRDQKKVYRMQLIAIPLLLLLVLIGEYRPQQNDKRNELWINTSPEYRYLKDRQLKDGQLFVFCETRYVYLYNQFRILAPSRWLYHHFWFWYPEWDKDGRILHSITEELQQHQTTYILDCSDGRPEFMHTAHYPRWKNFLNTYYTAELYLLSNRKGILWKRK